MVEPTDVESSDPIVDEFVDQTTGGVKTTPENRCPRGLGKLAATLEVKKVVDPSLSGVTPLKPLESVVIRLCLAWGGEGTKPE